MIDLAVLSLLTVPVYGLRFLAIPAYVAYFALLTARSGQTVGKRLMGIQVQDASGEIPPLPRCVWRAAVDVCNPYRVVALIALSRVSVTAVAQARASCTDLHHCTTRLCAKPSHTARPVWSLFLGWAIGMKYWLDRRLATISLVIPWSLNL